MVFEEMWRHPYFWNDPHKRRTLQVLQILPSRTISHINKNPPKVHTLTDPPSR